MRPLCRTMRRTVQWQPLSIPAPTFSTAAKPSSPPKYRTDVSVLIVGAEVEAFVCAIALRRFGVKTTIIHHKKDFDHAKDRGLLIPISAQRIFDRIHLNHRIEEIGTSMHMFSKMDHTGSLFGQINFKELANIHGYPAYSVKKEELLKLLETCLSDNSPGDPIALQRNVRLEALEHQRTNEGLRVLATLRPSSGPPLKTSFDYVISGEGDFSRVRDLLWTPSEIAQRVACGRYGTIIRRPKSFPMHGSFEMWGPGNVLGGQALGDDFYVWGMFLPEEAPPLEGLYSMRNMKEFLERFKDFQGPFRSLIPELQKKQFIQLEHPIETILTAPIVSNRVALIGKAARGISPLVGGHDLGQAVEDALTVAECITSPVLDPDLALRKYEAVRKGRAGYVQRLAWTQTRAALTSRQDWRMKLKSFLMKLDNSTSRLTEKENELIGFDSRRLKG